MASCLIVFSNYSVTMSSMDECNYYNYHIIWAMLILVTCVIMFLQKIVNGVSDVNRWGALWMFFLVFGIEIGAIAGVIIAMMVSENSVDEDAPVAVPVESVPVGIPVADLATFQCDS